MNVSGTSLVQQLYMIVLPDTPPYAKIWKPVGATPFLTHLSDLRSSVNALPVSSYNDTVRLTSHLEEYLEGIFQLVSSTQDLTKVIDAATFSLALVICNEIPWEYVYSSVPKKHDIKFGKRQETCSWNLACEIQTVIISISLSYIRLGADVNNELIEMNSSEELDEKWKMVTNFYKKAMVMSAFGSEFSQYTSIPQMDPRLFLLLDSVANIGLQTSILSKFSSVQRHMYNDQDKFSDDNNATLCRVSIWALDEIKKCQRLVTEMLHPTNDLHGLKTNKWNEYLSLVTRYTSAYAGFFLSIEYYQKGALGKALGLVNFSLLTLQSKSLPKEREGSKIISKFKNKLAGRANENYIVNLQSTTTLVLDKSSFRELLGIILKDLALLFDMLVQCRLKYSKENDNLRFETVVKWQDIHTDSKWPLGSKIPVSKMEPYYPKSIKQESYDSIKLDYSGRGNYF